MRLSFVRPDGMIIIDGVGVKVRESKLGAPEGLHALQRHPNGFTEVEWVDDMGRAQSVSNGTGKLPGGEAYIKKLVALHKTALEETPPQ